jgi:hypothetical protein
VKKEKINFIVDAVAFAAFVLLASTGILMSYVLPPGSGHFSLLWGMDRHEWGRYHFWFAVILMASLGFHLILHWRWISCMIKGGQREGSGIRVALSVVGIISLLSLAALPFMGRVELTGGEPPHRLRSAERGEGGQFQIDGSMTLADVEKLTGIPSSAILRELGLPVNLPKDVSLGRLRKEYGFEMNGVRDVVRKLDKKNSGSIKGK